MVAPSHALKALFLDPFKQPLSYSKKKLLPDSLKKTTLLPLKNSLHRSKTTAPSHTLKALSFYPLKNGTLSHSNPLLMHPASFQMVPLVPSRAPGYYVKSFR